MLFKKQTHFVVKFDRMFSAEHLMLSSDYGMGTAKPLLDEMIQIKYFKSQEYTFEY